MRTPPTPWSRSAILCSVLILLAGCGSNTTSSTLASLTITATPSTLPVGGAAVLKALAHLSDGTTQDVSASAQWTLSNPALATLSNGTLAAKAPGTVSVQAAYVVVAPAGTSPSSTPVAPLTSSAQVTITSASGPGSIDVPVLTWTQPAAVSYGTALSATQLSATANVPGTFVYSPAAGSVLHAGPQTLSVAFTPTDTTTYSAAVATAQLTVTQMAPAIAWVTPANITAGTVLSGAQLDASANVPGSFTYSPAAGTTMKAGTQQLTAMFSPTDPTDYSSATAHSSVVVSPSPTNPTGQVVPIITWNAPAGISYGATLSSTQLSAAANVPGTFAYTPAAGAVLKAGTQTLSATFTPTNTTTSSSATASVQLTVTPALPVITWAAPAPITAGTALSVKQLAATASVPGSFMYNPAAGVILAAGTQHLTAVLSPTDGTDYSSATAQSSLVVNPSPKGPTGQIVPTITWNAPAAISYGTALSSTQLSATASVPGTFAYTPAAAIVLKAGTQTLSATFTPTNTTTTSTTTGSVQLTVTPAPAVITWATPAPVASGATLSATQLNATANVPGSFMYSPAAGTVLATGTQALTAAFSPSDATDYSPATAHTSLVVNAPPSSPGTGPTGPTPGAPQAPTGCGGPTINLNSGMNESTLHSTIASAPTCSLIVFAAGTYTISSPMSIPCSSKLTLTGPAASPATAILNATFTKNNIFTMSGCSGITIEFLHFQNTGGIHITTPAAGITIEYNQFTGLPGDETQGSDSGVYIQGSGQNTLSSTVISWNTFGSANDCNGAMTRVADQGGLCSGIMWQSSTNGFTMENNTFFHLEEGIKLVCIGSCEPPNSITENNVYIKNNDFQQIHRIAIEMQPQPSQNVYIQYNSYSNDFDGYWSTMGWSHPCCDTGARSPGVVDNDNVVVANNPPASPPTNDYLAIAVEFWGNGSQGDRNLVEGYWANGFSWGYGAGSWEIRDNTICGPDMAKSNSYIANEEHQSNPPSQSGNTVSATCKATPSTAPTISPAAGAISGATTITLSDSGINHSIYYTTDGSTPTTSSKLYTGPFSVNPGTTVQSIGMWGQGANTKSYPAGYGYAPSSVVSAAYAGTTANLRPAIAEHISPANVARAAAPPVRPAVPPIPPAPPVSPTTNSATLQAVTITPSPAVVTIGSTTQLRAEAAFSDGSVKDVSSEFSWQSSDARTITASASGAMAGLATGPATISGSYQGMQATAAATSAVGEVEWSAPIVITEGGTYSGNWQSTDPNTPAVMVSTTAAVVIENSHMRSVGSLIKTGIAGSSLTVRNSLGVAANAGVKGQPNGAFLEVTSPMRLAVENNYIENARGGVIVHGYAGNRDGEETILIRGNRARNLNGLLSDGNGGYLPGEGANRVAARFIQLDSVQSVPGIDVGWNEVINYPGHSLVEDNIDVYRSGGTPNRPLEIHDTYIQGAYPSKPGQDAYTGGGIKTDGKPGDSAQEVPAFNSIHDNQVVGTVNYGIEFAAGHDNVAFNNRVISSGLLADGTKIAAQQMGMANGDPSGSAVAAGSMYNNTMRDNFIGWTCWKASCAKEGYRKDQYFPASPADYSSNTVLPGPITLDVENNEYQVWVNKMNTAGIAVGPAF